MDVDHSDLLRSDTLTMSLNNAHITFKSDLWLGVDHPNYFRRAMWMDASIEKYTLRANANRCVAGKPLRKTKACPNVYYYRRNAWFTGEQMYAPHDPAIWDNSPGSGYRTSIIDALRVLYLLGIRCIFLLGVDFYQAGEHSYHCLQKTTPSSRKRNNLMYQKLAIRLTNLRPLMEQAGLQVFNCNKNSRLKAFDYLSVAEAISMASSNCTDSL